MLALFRAKFACNSALRYPVFRWELYKGCVWKNVKKTQDVCIKRSLTTGKLPKWHTCEVCRKLKGHDSWSTTGQKVQSGLEINSRLKLVTRSSHEAESLECFVLLKTDILHSSRTLL